MPSSAQIADVLEIRDEHGGCIRRPLTEPRVIVGRSSDADLKLTTDTVSRRHAELVRDPFGRWWVRDLESHNGTFLNAQRVTEAMLHADDVLQIGEFTLHLLPAAPESVASPPPHTSTAGQATSVSLSTRDDAGVLGPLRRVEPAKVASEHLARLASFGDELIATEDPGQRLANLCSLMVSEQFHGHAALALRLERGIDPSEPAVLSPLQQRPGVVAMVSHISRTLLRAVLHEGEAMMATNANSPADAGAAFGPGVEAIELSIGADVTPMGAIACPLRHDAQAMDVLYLTCPPEYANSEWLALVALTVRQYQQAELAWAGRRQAEALAAIERELEQAHQIQMRLVPRRRQIPGLDTAIAFEPCRWVGGDYADILPMGDGRVLLTVADVCGKGMQAALTTASVHTMVHASVRAGASLIEIMRHLNAYLIETLPDSSFVTMVCVLIDPATGAIESVNAGHPPALVVNELGELRHMQEAKNLPLGIAPDEPELEHGHLEMNEWIALYSDGVTELSDEQGQMLGIEGVAQQLRTACAAPATPAAPAADHASRAGDPHERAPDLDDPPHIRAAHVTTALLEHAKHLRDQGLAADDWTLLVARRHA